MRDELVLTGKPGTNRAAEDHCRVPGFARPLHHEASAPVRASRHRGCRTDRAHRLVELSRQNAGEWARGCGHRGHGAPIAQAADVRRGPIAASANELGKGFDHARLRLSAQSLGSRQHGLTVRVSAPAVDAIAPVRSIRVLALVEDRLRGAAADLIHAIDSICPIGTLVHRWPARVGRRYPLDASDAPSIVARHHFAEAGVATYESRRDRDRHARPRDGAAHCPTVTGLHLRDR